MNETSELLHRVLLLKGLVPLRHTLGCTRTTIHPDAKTSWLKPLVYNAGLLAEDVKVTASIPLLP